MPTTQEGRLLKLKTPLADDFLLIKRIRSFEGISQLFRYELEILHEEDEAGDVPTLVDPQQLLGKEMTVTISQDDGGQRFFNGICVDFTQGHRNERFSKYRAELVPQFWLLTQNSQSRIFQNISVPEILRKVLKGLDVTYEIQGTFEPRNYCVQYRESDFNFASRLMEEEGIYYYFEHTAESHRMIVANTPGSHRECPTKAQIPFRLDVSALEEEWLGCIRSWQTSNKLRAGKFTLRDHNFELPDKSLETEELSRFNIGGNRNMEIYDYPGGYAKRFDGIDAGGGERPADVQKISGDGERTAGIRQEELDVAYKGNPGTSDCCALTAGYRFQMTEHSNSTDNRNHVLLSVRSEGVQSPTYISDESVENPFMVSFTALPQGEGQAPFRPSRRAVKPFVQGSQTAIVVGPSGEEIFTDKYGRVKVQFRWDRQGKYDASSSCWVRVVQTWAGKKWGMMFIPRIGMEVVVDFLEGDPDQPIIAGCVYNAEAMPPYELPAEKTKSTMKTNSSKGGGGFNELRFEDKKGSEQIFIHAEKNQDIRVKNDCMELIKHDRHLIVDNDQYEKVKKDKHLQIGGDHNEKIGGSMSVTIGADLQEKVSSNYAIEAGSGVHIKAGSTVVVEAPTSLTLKVGGNFININSGGIFIKGTMVMINSGGAAGPGAGSDPDAPKDPKEADNAVPGSNPKLPPPNAPVPATSLGPMAAQLRRASQSGAPFCATCPRR